MQCGGRHRAWRADKGTEGPQQGLWRRRPESSPWQLDSRSLQWWGLGGAEEVAAVHPSLMRTQAMKGRRERAASEGVAE